MTIDELKIEIEKLFKDNEKYQEAIFFALTYIRYIKSKNTDLHMEADGSPSVEKMLNEALGDNASIPVKDSHPDIVKVKNNLERALELFFTDDEASYINSRFNLTPGIRDAINLIDSLEKSLLTVTCAFCGKEYPRGTPRHGDDALTDHILKCPDHPMRELEAELDQAYEDLEDMNAASADALEKLWQDIIIANRPDYGPWEYPGQAYRHILLEFTELKENYQKLANALNLIKIENKRHVSIKNIVIDYNDGTSHQLPLDDFQAIVGAIRSIGQKEFRDSLNRNSDLVRTWPKWKRDILGDILGN